MLIKFPLDRRSCTITITELKMLFDTEKGTLSVAMTLQLKTFLQLSTDCQHCTSINSTISYTYEKCFYRYKLELIKTDNLSCI